LERVCGSVGFHLNMVLEGELRSMIHIEPEDGKETPDIFKDINFECIIDFSKRQYLVSHKGVFRPVLLRSREILSVLEDYQIDSKVLSTLEECRINSKFLSVIEESQVEIEFFSTLEQFQNHPKVLSTLEEYRIDSEALFMLEEYNINSEVLSFLEEFRFGSDEDAKIMGRIKEGPWYNEGLLL
jgi:hypothetical protein